MNEKSSCITFEILKQRPSLVSSRREQTGEEVTKEKLLKHTREQICDIYFKNAHLYCTASEEVRQRVLVQKYACVYKCRILFYTRIYVRDSDLYILKRCGSEVATHQLIGTCIWSLLCKRLIKSLSLPTCPTNPLPFWFMYIFFFFFFAMFYKRYLLD